MDKALSGRSLTWAMMAALAVAVIAAGVARGLDAWHGVLTILGAALQIVAVAYATRSVWLPKSRTQVARLVNWLRRRVLRRAFHHVDAATAIATGTASGVGRRGTLWPKTQAAQVAALMRWVDTLVGDVDALHDRITDVEAGSASALAARAEQLERMADRQFRLTNEDALVAGVLAILGALLALVGELVA
ncbi:MAG: hypothetical protein M3Q31_05475 [Actinomycetota bacterium]|nr:hypothetical protein [Actinomycetota bacterium]